MRSRSSLAACAILLGACGGQTDSNRSAPRSDAGANETGVRRDGSAASAGSGGGVSVDAGVPDVGFPPSCPAQNVPVVFHPLDAVLCSAAVVASPQPPFRPDHVNLRITHAEQERTLYYVDSPDACADVGDADPGIGWWYDDRANPKRFLFCPQTCPQIEAAGGMITVLYGCYSGPLP
jgi:hypothetical protein